MLVTPAATVTLTTATVPFEMIPEFELNTVQV
jgi:hypothetical protein